MNDSVSQLTKREKQVYSLLTEGLSDKQISERLGITPKTAGLHVYRVLHKQGYTNRNQVLIALIAQLQQELEEATTRLSWLETYQAGGMEAVRNRTELARMELERE